jgi:hypothetical protein
VGNSRLNYVAGIDPTPDPRQGWPKTDYGSAVTNPRIRV